MATATSNRLEFLCFKLELIEAQRAKYSNAAAVTIMVTCTTLVTSTC